MWNEYIEILSDPAHVFAEGTFVLFEIAIISPIIGWLVRQHDKKHH